MKEILNIAVLASGTGSNADRICAHFAKNEAAKVSLIVTNNAKAGVLKVAERYGVLSHVVQNPDIDSQLLEVLKNAGSDLVVLAGFLRKIPASVIRDFEGRIVNIHPALLPKYGGKGMYGPRVHEAVIAAGESESGITIHHVNEQYDEGSIIFQARCPVGENDTPETLAKKIHQLEHEHYPKVIEQLIFNLKHDV